MSKKIFIFAMALAFLVSVPLAHAQKPKKVYRIGFLTNGETIMKRKKLAVRIFWPFFAMFFVSIFFGAEAVAQTVRGCVLANAETGCVYEVTATSNGHLSVDTRAGTTGDTWRTTVAEVGRTQIKTNLGNRSSAVFSGNVSRNVGVGKTYVVIVTYECMLSTEDFPASVDVRFDGPVGISGSGPR